MANQKRPGGSRPDQGSGRPSQPGKADKAGVAVQEGAPRRLGGQTQAPRGPKSAGAARRYDRSRKKSSSWVPWASVGVVVVLIVVLVAIKLTGGSSPTSSSSSGIASGRSPAAAPASLVSAMATIPASAYNSVGTDGQAASFTVTKGQSPLLSGGKPQFVYVGGEYCPYCALGRWSLVAALSRFGTFHNLKITSSDSQEGTIPTYSFLGTTYTSNYVTFSPYEEADRNDQPLQTLPNYIAALSTKYDGNGSTAALPFNSSGSAGIPFFDVGNKYVSSGDPNFLAVIAGAPTYVGPLSNGGPGRLAIADALHAPSSSIGKSISASAFLAEANYISAAICSVDGGKPASVCTSPGVKAAATALAAVKPVG